MEPIEVSAKTLDEAITKACIELGAASDDIEYEILETGSNGILGIGARPYVIKVWVKPAAEPSMEDKAYEFLSSVFEGMGMEVSISINYVEAEKELAIELSGEDMGVLIGKRGQTLDALQYLTSQVVNKNLNEYIRVKLDTENYRERRQETLETLAKNISYKVKRTRRPVALEPMNPYERRIIHSALQADKDVMTRSEGEEPYRHVVICCKKKSRADRERGEKSRSEA